MKIFIEGYNYPADNNVFKKYANIYSFRTHANGTKYCISEVGYFYDKSLNDCVFFLPKVLLEDLSPKDYQGSERDLRVFGKYKPEDIIELDHPGLDKKIDVKEREFIHNFSVWIYRTLCVYRSSHGESSIVKDNKLSHLDNSKNSVQGTILDVILALVNFYEKNKDYLLFTIRNSHSGFNKINWPKTIATKKPVKQKSGSFIYLSVVNKRKEVNNEEELLVIFYSILNYINKRQGFTIKFNVNLELIPIEQFESYRRGLGKSRLLQIKYKYFSDKSLLLWNLCYRYFDVYSHMYSSSQQLEYLTVTDFDRVFESIIDNLIGDPDIDKQLQNQQDGKIVDHIFPYDSLIRREQDIYYIGDSKYYMMGHEVKGTNSEYKQYTYAKNIIQYNLGLFLDESIGVSRDDKQSLPYRDELTEGYNVTPNFFISAKIKRDLLDYNVNDLQHRTDQDSFERQFFNRLFDRDTLWLSHYDINFLFVIALYVRNNNYAKEKFKKQTRELFRANLIPVISRRYRFYILLNKIGKDRLEKDIRTIFKDVIGKVYSPDPNRPILILALERDDQANEMNKIINEKYLQILTSENNRVLELLKNDFYILSDYELGTDYIKFIEDSKNKYNLPQFLLNELKTQSK